VIACLVFSNRHLYCHGFAICFAIGMFVAICKLQVFYLDYCVGHVGSHVASFLATPLPLFFRFDRCSSIFINAVNAYYFSTIFGKSKKNNEDWWKQRNIHQDLQNQLQNYKKLIKERQKQCQQQQSQTLFECNGDNQKNTTRIASDKILFWHFQGMAARVSSKSSNAHSPHSGHPC
jgi:hypothetical protein